MLLFEWHVFCGDIERVVDREWGEKRPVSRWKTDGVGLLTRPIRAHTVPRYLFHITRPITKYFRDLRRHPTPVIYGHARINGDTTRICEIFLTRRVTSSYLRLDFNPCSRSSFCTRDIYIHIFFIFILSSNRRGIKKEKLEIGAKNRGERVKTRRH